jgi:hypothetical protein
MVYMGGFFALYRTSPPSQPKQLYLGTRYTGLLGFVFSFIYIDAHGVSCQVRLWQLWDLGQRSSLTSTSSQ